MNITDFARVFIWYIRKGLVYFLIDLNCSLRLRLECVYLLTYANRKCYLCWQEIDFTHANLARMVGGLTYDRCT